MLFSAGPVLAERTVSMPRALGAQLRAHGMTRAYFKHLYQLPLGFARSQTQAEPVIGVKGAERTNSRNPSDGFPDALYLGGGFSSPYTYTKAPTLEARHSPVRSKRFKLHGMPLQLEVRAALDHAHAEISPSYSRRQGPWDGAVVTGWYQTGKVTVRQADVLGLRVWTKNATVNGKSDVVWGLYDPNKLWDWMRGKAVPHGRLPLPHHDRKRYSFANLNRRVELALDLTRALIGVDFKDAAFDALRREGKSEIDLAFSAGYWTNKSEEIRVQHNDLGHSHLFVAILSDVLDLSPRKFNALRLSTPRFLIGTGKRYERSDATSVVAPGAGS
ncbi:MAG: hypothetical protein H6707_21790 [Deltaproteobacteria bacterium]|nr:hypothetical protein [Deltaproteobacteria bacterium]